MENAGPTSASAAIEDIFADEATLMAGVEGVEQTPAAEPEPIPATEAPDPVVVEEDNATPEGEEAEKEADAEGEGAEKSEEGAKPDPKPTTREPVTQFKTLSADGTEVEAPPLEIEYKADGKVLREPLDKVVRRAQMGAYNESLVRDRDTLKGRAGELEMKLTEREQLVALREQQIERLLTDPSFFDQAKDAYDAYNNPEARAERAERALTERTLAEQRQAQEQVVIQFVQERLLPAYEELSEKYPSITGDEIRGRFDRLTAPWRVNGVIPPNRLPDVEHLLREDFGPWAAQLHESRTASARAVKDASATEVRRAQEEAAAAKRTLAQATAPARTSGTASTAKPARTIRTADDAVADIEAMLASM